MLNFSGSKFEGSTSGTPMYESSVSLSDVLDGHDENAEVGTTNSKFQAMEIKSVNKKAAFKSGELYLEVEWLTESQVILED